MGNKNGYRYCNCCDYAIARPERAEQEMSNAPAHAAEHNTLMQVVAKIVNKSVLIDTVVLITVGVDGRPSVGGNLDNPEQIMELLRQLIAAEGAVEGVRRIDLPKDN